MTELYVAVLPWLSVVVLYCGTGLAALAWWKHRSRAADAAFDPAYRPAVAVLKPLAGADEELEANLRSLLELDYEPLQIIFGAGGADDPGLVVARKLQAEYPHREVLILADCRGPAPSPKVANLEAMLPHARHELVLLSDSNVRFDRGELSRLVQPMRDEQVGLVYQPVVGVGEQTAAAALENIRQTEFAGYADMAIKMVGNLDSVTGKGVLCRRAALEAIGGFSTLRDRACEDFYLGVLVKQAGRQVYLSELPVRTVHVRWSWRALWRRHQRHAAMRWRVNALTCLVELSLFPWLWAAWAAAVAGWRGFLAVAAVTVGKWIVEATVVRSFRGQALAWRHLWIMPLKELVFPATILWGLVDGRVEWRGRRFRMTRGARLKSLDAAEPEAASQVVACRPVNGPEHWQTTAATNSDPPSSASPAIPKIIHQTWKNATVPEKFRPWVESWRTLHPEWEYRLWTDADNQRLIDDHYPQYADFYRRLDHPILRVDFVRNCYLHRFGGLYVDLDFEALRPLDPLLEKPCVVFGEEFDGHGRYARGRDYVMNALAASPAGHPFWPFFMARMCANYRRRGRFELAELHVMNSCLGQLDAAAREYQQSHDDLVIHPYQAFYPTSHLLRDSAERRRRAVAGNAYAVHHYEESWHSLPARCFIRLHYWWRRYALRRIH